MVGSSAKEKFLGWRLERLRSPSSLSPFASSLHLAEFPPTPLLRSLLPRRLRTAELQSFVVSANVRVK